MEHPLLPRSLCALPEVTSWSSFDLSGDVYFLFTAWTIIFAAGEKLAGYASAKRVVYDMAVYPYATLYYIIMHFVRPYMEWWSAWFASVEVRAEGGCALAPVVTGSPSAALTYMHRPTASDMVALARATTVPPVFISARPWPGLWAHCCSTGRPITPRDLAVGVCWYPERSPPCLTFIFHSSSSSSSLECTPMSIFSAVEVSSSLLHVQATRQAAYLSHCIYKARKSIEGDPIRFAGILDASMTLDEARRALLDAGYDNDDEILRDLARIAVAVMHHENTAVQLYGHNIVRQKQSNLTFQFSPSVPWDAIFSDAYERLSPYPIPHLLDVVDDRVLLGAVRLPDPL